MPDIYPTVFSMNGEKNQVLSAEQIKFEKEFCLKKTSSEYKFFPLFAQVDRSF